MASTVHTDEDRRFLLQTVGVSAVEDLFSPIPPALRRHQLGLAPGLTEAGTRERVENLAAMNRAPGPASFLGAGCYRHFVPAAVRALASRGEFATAYTPYQPEVSQGTLQHIFEFQTCICELTGLDAGNASLYDGPSALAEAAFMALRLTQRDGILVSAGVHPVEPTETEDLRTLDAFVAAMEQIEREPWDDPELARGAPHSTPVHRPDEVRAARHPILRWPPDETIGAS